MRERYLTPAARRQAFTRRSTLFQDVVVRCVRYAFTNIPSKIGRVFLSKEVALPFLRFRMLRRGYIGLGGIGLGKKHPRWKQVQLGGLNGIWIAHDLSAKPDIVVYYCHGGGMTMGSSWFYLEFLLSWVSTLADIGFKNPAIFALEYTLVPDEIYPFQLQEAIAGYSYAQTHAGINSKIVLSGDSAGGTLMLSLLLYLGAKAQEHKPMFAALISPWTNLVSERNCNTAADFVDTAALHRYGLQYAGSAQACRDPLVSPGDCEDDAWWEASLPSNGLGFYYGTEEIFCDNIRLLAARLGRLGPVVCREDQTVHAWPIAAMFLESTAEKRGRGLRRISSDIAKFCL